MWAGIFLQKEIICTCNSNILQIWSLFSLDAASFEAVFRARNIDRSKDNVQTEGELTDQSFVLTVMFICYIQSYWKWSKLKFPYYSVVSVVISMQWVTGYCGTLIWNSGWNAHKLLFTIRAYLRHLQQWMNCTINIFRKGAGKPVGCLQSALTDVVSMSWFSSSATCSRSNNNLPVLLLTYWLAHMYLYPETDSTAENNQQKVNTFINLVLRVLSKSQNWLAGPWLDQTFWQWKRLFPRGFAEKPSPLWIIYFGFDWPGQMDSFG